MQAIRSMLDAQLKLASLDEEERRAFHEHTKEKRVARGCALIRSGDPVRHAYYCAEGLFRMYYELPDGKEFNKGFLAENDFAASYGAMITGETSPFTIEALEDAVVIEIPYALIERLTAGSHRWERFMRQIVEKLYLKKEERERQLLYLNAEQRYDAFRSKHPELMRRIPQYHIASHVGISPESLSRLLRAKRT